MKRVIGMGVILTVTLLVGAPLVALAAEPSQVAADHLALAASYEQKATEQDALIAEHTQMKADYKDRFFINEKVTPLDKVREMETHCDAIIKNAQTEKAKLLDFANWHRMRAAELQGL